MARTEFDETRPPAARRWLLLRGGKVISRNQVFELEFRYLLAVELEAKKANVKWLSDLTRELREKIPPFVKQLESEESKQTTDKDK